MQITRRSLTSGKVHTRELDITLEQIRKYESGVLLQDAFPHLPPEEREFFMTGITPEEWKAVFGSEEDDE